MNEGEAPHFTDAVGKTVPRPFVPPQVASPINLLNPDRYEFYTFNDAGELVKRLMTLKEIQSIVANGNGAMIGDNEPESQSVYLNTIPLSNQGSETKVQDIVDNVQNVLSREMENNKNASQIHSLLLDTPDVSSSWSMILPAIFGNTGDEILPHKPINMTPETEIEETTTTKSVQTTRRPVTKVPTTKTYSRTTPLTKVPAKVVQTSKAPPKLTTSTYAPTKPSSTTYEPSSSKIQTSTKKQPVKAKPKPTSPTTRTTSTTTTTTAKTSTTTTTKTPLPTENQTEATTMEIKRTTTNRPTTSKVSPTKKFVRKPTSPGYKRPLTNSPIIIEKIQRRPIHVETKTDANLVERKTASSTLEMKVDSTTKAPMSVGPVKVIAVMTKTEAPSTTINHHISSYKTNLPVTTKTTTVAPVKVSTEQNMLSTSEEDRQDSAINQIIGSLQSDLFSSYEKVTTDSPVEETTNDAAMDRLGDLNLVPDKVLLNDQLYIDESEPVIKYLPTTTTTEIPLGLLSSSGEPMYEKLEVTTTKTKDFINSNDNSEVMQKIEMLIKETNAKPEKLDALSFDDDDETEIKFKDTLEIKEPMKHSEFVHKAATVASILSTRTTESTSTTTAQPLSEESDSTVPTILSDALSNAIQLMMAQQESKKTEKPTPTTTPQSDEPSGYDLTQVLHHYQDLNYKQDQLESLSLLTEKLLTTELPEAETTTVYQESEEVSHETTIVKETSSVSMKKGEHLNTESTTSQPEILATTTDASKEEFSTFFFVDKDQDETTTLDPLHDGLGEFSTQQYVETVKRLSDRKDETFATTISPLESEESGELVSHVLNAIGIASDSEEEESTEKLKATESQENEEVENAILSLTSEIGNTLTNDVKTDFKLTSKIASSLISVADSISETLNADEESEEGTTFVPTTVVPDVKQDQSTEKSDEMEDSTEDKNEQNSTETNNDESMEHFSLDQETKPAQLEEDIKIKPSATKLAVEVKPTLNSPNQLVQLSVIRKDNSLEEIDFITPSTPTSTRIPITEGNFIKIENIETTSLPKPTHAKIKGHETFENVKPIFISVRGTTTSKSNSITHISPTKATHKKEQTEKTQEADTPMPVTERVPLIEVTKSTDFRQSSTEDNLVEIKVQTKPTTVAPTSTESHPPTTNQFVSNAQTIKNTIKNSQQQLRPLSPPVDLPIAPKESLGLAASTQNLNKDLSDFSKLCNELAFSFWKSITNDGISQSRSVIISPFALTSTLSMIFLGARGQTSGEMNDLLRLDDMVSFNPHVVFRNISESIEQSRNSGIAAAAFVRELYSDRSKGKLLPYFKEKAQQFYGAHVEEVNFNVINDILRRRTNLLVKRHTFSKLNEYLKTNNIWVNEPLAAVSANVFLVSCHF